MDSLRQTVAKVALSDMDFIPLVGSILRLWRGPSLRAGSDGGKPKNHKP